MKRLRGPFSQVVAIDLPGHGRSYHGESPPSGDEMRQAVGEAVEALLDEPAIVYGNSLGGYASIRLAIDRTSSVRALLLASPGGAPMTPLEMDDVLSVFRMRTHREAMAFMARIMETRSWITPLMAQACLGRLTQPHMVPMLNAISSARLLDPDLLAEISVPTVLMWGKGERLFSQSAHDFFAEHMPENTAFDYPEGAGHVPHSDRPGYVSRRLLALAETHSG